MASTTAAKVIATCLILAVSMQMCYGSAIPIWEFLTRNDKMHFLYSTFAQLVSTHCKATAATSAVPVNQCKRNLLNYGYEKLQTFSEAQLDAFDPYQRGANELIWSSIMHDHPSSTLITTRNPLPTPPASSLIILTHQKAAQPAAAAAASTPHHQYAQNPLFDNDAEHKHQYAMDMDIAYGYPSRPTHAQAETFEHSPQNSHSGSTQPQQKTYLTGPLVFRVRPDGTPVEEDQYKPLPRDDDLEAFQLSTPNANTNSARPNKHRKIATISALKQQHLATLALQQQLLPPLEQPRRRRQFAAAGVSHSAVQQASSDGYFYGQRQT